MSRPSAIWLLTVLPCFGGLACAATSRTGTRIAEASRPHTPVVVQAPASVVTPDESLSVDDLFRRGLSRFERRQFSAAARDLENVALSLPGSADAQLAWYRAGIARDESGDFAAAVHDLTQATSPDERSVLARDASIRLLRLLVFLERWADAGDRARRVARVFQNLNPIEAIVVKGALALDAIGRSDTSLAAREIESARTIIEERQFDTAAQLQRDVAVIYFALGELRRMRGAERTFVPFPQDFSEQLERRCQLLLDAQSAYSMAMRAYDSHWSVMAGYRVGQLYEDLHEDLMKVLAAIPLPGGEQKRLFEAALRLRYAILLEKAAKSLEHTLALAQRTDEHSSWVALARDALEKLRQETAREREALARVPYSRDQLWRALEHLIDLHGAARSTPQ